MDFGETRSDMYDYHPSPLLLPSTLPLMVNSPLVHQDETAFFVSYVARPGFCLAIACFRILGGLGFSRVSSSLHYP